MKKHASNIFWIAVVTPMVAFSHAQDESSEPIELIRLREQFSNRIDQEMKPWRDRYAQELQKLEDRLIKERKLSEALAVKKEKENYLTADLTKKPEKPAVPSTVEKAKEAMIGSVWLVYDAEDKKRENLLDAYHFVDGKNVCVLTSKRLFPWSAKSTEEVSIEFIAGNIVMEVYFDKSNGTPVYQGKSYTAIMVSKSER